MYIIFILQSLLNVKFCFSMEHIEVWGKDLACRDVDPYRMSHAQADDRQKSRG